MSASNDTQPSPYQYALCIGGLLISPPLLLRNIYRMNYQLKHYKHLLTLMDASPMFPRAQKLSLIVKEDVVINVNAPKMLSKLVSGVENKMFSRQICRFYEQLQSQPCEVSYRYRGKQHTIALVANKTLVGRQLVDYGRTLIEQKKKIHVQQSLSIYGTIFYSQKSQQVIMTPKMIGLDHEQMRKYWKCRLVALCLSSFYWSIFLGVNIGIYIKAGFNNIWPFQIVSNKTTVAKFAVKIQAADDQSAETKAKE